MTPRRLTEAQIRQHASEESFARGVDYYRHGAVGPLVLRGELLQAHVEGSQYEPYQVVISLDAGGVRAASCTCPYDWGGWCKHIVATLLAYASVKPDEIEVRPPLSELLAGLDREQLATLVLLLAGEQPGLAARIDALLASAKKQTSPTPSPSTASRTTSAAAPAASIPNRRTTVDAQTFRQQIRRIFRDQRRDNYLAYERILADLQPLVAQIRGFIDGNDERNALLLLEALTAEYGELWVDFDDSDGELGGFFAELGALWAEALLGANLKKAERVGWRERLEAWAAEAEEYGCDGLELAVRAAREGWDDPWIDGAVLGELLPGSQPPGGITPDLMGIRLRLLERKGQTWEALNLAVAAGMVRERAQLLVRLGRTAEALEVGREQFSTAGEALELAQLLRERGDVAGALSVAERGLELRLDAAGGPRQELEKARLAAWLVDLAAGQGRVDLALRAGAEALQVEPELGLYRRLGELAGAGWPALREQLLAALRASKSWRVSGRLDIFLHEGLIDDAIAALGVAPSGTDLARVMDAAVATRPDWAISRATASAEGIMNAGDAKHYDSAVAWLRRARAAYQAAGRTQDWTAYLQQLRATHSRKHKLIALLDGLERSRR